MPKDIPLENSLRQSANLGALIIGLQKADYGLISRSLIDHIAEPYRSQFIPGFDKLKQSIMDNGGLGGGISGSGPSVFALSNKPDTAREIGSAMKEVMSGQGIDSDIYISKINSEGPIVIEG